MISVWKRKEDSHLGIRGVQHYSWGLSLVPHHSPKYCQDLTQTLHERRQVDCTWLLCLLDFHRLQQQAWTLEAERLRFESRLCHLPVV